MLTSRPRLILLTGISLAVASLSGAFVGILIYGTLLLDDEAIPLQWLVMTPLMILVLVVLPAALVTARGARHLWRGDEVSLSDVTAPPNRFVIAAVVFLALYMTIFYAIVPLYEMAVGR